VEKDQHAQHLNGRTNLGPELWKRRQDGENPENTPENAIFSL